MSAADEKQVAAPLIEAGLDKRRVRELAKYLGLETWDKPASPCLASRIPYHEEVTREKLSRVESAERVLRSLGFRVCRVRCQGDVGRIEVPVADLARFLDDNVRLTLVRGLRDAGFRFVTLDLEGFRSGRLNEALGEE